ncbi:unnamed protein product, partial [Oreochromis niloticus]
MSSLEKCFACGGPFSPLKWSGVRCEVCYQSWHKRCYVSHKVNLTEPLPEVFSEDSSSEGASSEEEYVPDSIADSDSSWDNKSEPLNISCKQVQNSEISSSQSACKTKRPRLESFLERVGQRISEDAESISEDGIGTRQLDVSGVIATAEKSDAEGIVDDSDTTAEDSLKTSSSLRNKTYCYICGKLQTKFTRHLKTHEKSHADVARVLSLPKKSKDRLKMLSKLRNKGNHRHNSEVIASGIGSLKTRRTSKKPY